MFNVVELMIARLQLKERSFAMGKIKEIHQSWVEGGLEFAKELEKLVEVKKVTPGSLNRKGGKNANKLIVQKTCVMINFGGNDGHQIIRVVPAKGTSTEQLVWLLKEKFKDLKIKDPPNRETESSNIQPSLKETKIPKEYVELLVKMGEVPEEKFSKDFFIFLGNELGNEKEFLKIQSNIQKLLGYLKKMEAILKLVS